MSKNTAIWLILMLVAVLALFGKNLEVACTCIAAAFVVTAIDDAIHKIKP